MNQSKRTKGRIGSGGFNRGRNRGTSTPHSHTFQNDELKQPPVDIYQNPYLVHSIISLMGCLVEVTLPNGTVYEGILKTVSHTLDVTLEMAHIIQKKNGQLKIEEYTPVPTKECVIETLVIGLKSIVCIVAKDVDFDEVKKSDNFTDQGISNRLNGQTGNERPLQKWEDPSAEHDETIGLEETSMKNGFDPNEMFATNERKYGVKSTYDQNMLSYTTPVEGSKELEDKAAILAREIELGNISDHTELDSGKTEEERYSSVVRPSPAQGKPKTQVSTSKDENKRDAEVDKDMPTVSPPKPQRQVQQRERDGRISENKPTAVNDQIKSSSNPVSANSMSVEQEPKTENLPAKHISKPQVVSAAAGSGVAVVGIKVPGKISKEGAGDEQKENVVDDLKTFASNFKLAEEVPESEQSKDTSSSVQQPSSKEQTPSGEGSQQRNSPKVFEQPRKTDSPSKTTDKDKPSFKLRADAPVFQPRPMQRTPPVTPQQQYIPLAVSPSTTGPPYNIIRPTHQMKQPRSPFNTPNARFFLNRDHSDLHGSPSMSAAAATGSPIIAPAGFAPYFTVQGQPFHGGIQQFTPQGTYMIQPGPQGTHQQHFVIPHSVGNAAVQSVAQTYQDNSPMPVYASPLPMSPTSPYQGSPQPSPTTQGQFLQYIPQVIPQQQGNQPPMTQVIGSPNQQHMFVMPHHHPQQGGPQPLAIPVSGPPNSAMMSQFMPGQVGFAPRKQPNQWPHSQQQHPYQQPGT